MKIFLVDGSALLYRSHFAFAGRPLTTSQGEVTSAPFGFAQALAHLKDEEGADALVVALDAKGPTFRHELFPAYKAQRPPMPVDLASQIPRVRELVGALGVPLVELPGYEADDVLGTLARQLAPPHEVWIYSADKDFVPLVRPGVGILRPAARGGKDEYLDERAVTARYGLRPAQYLDALTLMGDQSDNVPGVPGVGEKTALGLVARHQSVARLLEDLDHAQELTPRLREALRASREQLPLTRRLLTIDTHAPVQLDVAAARLARGYPEAFLQLCRALEFYSLLERLPAQQASGPAAAAAGPDYRQVRSVDELRALLAELRAHTPWAIDTETTALDPLRAELVGISLAAQPGRAWYIPVAVADDHGAPGDLFGAASGERLPWAQVRSLLAPFLADARLPKVGQNLKYDQHVLHGHGAPLAGVEFDTMIASHLLAPERRQHGLDLLAGEVLRLPATPYKSLFDGLDTSDIRQVPLDRLTRYACEDADYALRLHAVFAPELVTEQLDHLMHDLEMPLSQVLLRMERHGVKLDVGLLETLSRELRAALARLTELAYAQAGEQFNLNSAKQLSVILFQKLGLKSARKTATGQSTDVDVLTKLAKEHPLPATLLEYRQLQKLLSTYAEALPKLLNPATGCLHTSFNQAVAATGRLSSSDPNLQNIPVRTELGRRIRAAFIPRDPGHLLLSADYSQIELRLMAHLSGDETLRAAFAAGEDVHARTAALVHGVALADVTPQMRRQAKVVNFGILYGMGARALAQQLEIPVRDAQAFIDGYFAKLPGVRRFIDETVELARREGEVRTILGRRRRLPELASQSPQQVALGERMAVNTPIQGSAADLIKAAMIRLDARIAREGLAAHLLLQVHDELIVEVEAGQRERVARAVKEEMEGVFALSVPLLVETSFGRNWAEAHA